MKPEYLRVALAAQWMNVSRKRVYTMVQEGKLDAVRLGPRSLRISRASVEALLDTLKRQCREDRGLSESALAFRNAPVSDHQGR